MRTEDRKHKPAAGVSVELNSGYGKWNVQQRENGCGQVIGVVEEEIIERRKSGSSCSVNWTEEPSWSNNMRMDSSSVWILIHGRIGLYFVSK